MELIRKIAAAVKQGIEKSKESSMKQGILWTGVLMVIFAAFFCLPRAAFVSNTVDGRELPIYCVETKEKKVALSFDAAWGNGILLELKTLNII